MTVSIVSEREKATLAKAKREKAKREKAKLAKATVAYDAYDANNHNFRFDCWSHSQVFFHLQNDIHRIKFSE